MINWPAAIGATGLVCAATGSILIAIANVTDIWKSVADSEYYDSLSDGRDKLLEQREITEDDQGYSEILNLVDEDSDVEKISVGDGGLGVRVGAIYAYQNEGDHFDDAEEIGDLNHINYKIDRKLDKIEEEAMNEILTIGMSIMFLGFILQAFAYPFFRPIV